MSALIVESVIVKKLIYVIAILLFPAVHGNLQLTIRGSLLPPTSLHRPTITTSIKNTTTTNTTTCGTTLPTPASTVTITCTFPPPSPPPAPSSSGYHSGLTIERIAFTSQTEENDDSFNTFKTLVDIGGPLADVRGRARDVSGLEDVTVAGSLFEGKAVLVLHKACCEKDAGEYFCASNAGTRRKDLHLLPDAVQMTSVLENVTNGDTVLSVKCSVFSTTRIRWEWEYKISDLSDWKNVSEDYSTNVTSDDPGVAERCHRPWTSRLTVPGSRDNNRSWRCCGVYEGENGETLRKIAVYRPEENTSPDNSLTSERVTTQVSSATSSASNPTSSTLKVERSSVEDDIHNNNNNHNKRKPRPQTQDTNPWWWLAGVGIMCLAVVVILPGMLHRAYLTRSPVTQPTKPRLIQRWPRPVLLPHSLADLSSCGRGQGSNSENGTGSDGLNSVHSSVDCATQTSLSLYRDTENDETNQ